MHKLNEKVRQFNAMSNEINELYHNAAVKLGISDSVFNILYIVCEAGDKCPQSRIYKESGISRQTINSAIRGLKQQGLVYMERGKDRKTTVYLTEQGKLFAHEKMEPIYQIEDTIFDEWTEEESSLYISLTAQYRDALKQKLEML